MHAMFSMTITLSSYTLLSSVFCSNPWLDKTILCISEFETFLNHLAFFLIFPLSVYPTPDSIVLYAVITEGCTKLRVLIVLVLSDKTSRFSAKSWVISCFLIRALYLSKIIRPRVIVLRFNPTLDLVEYEERGLATGPKLSALPAWACSYSRGDAKMFFFVSSLY